MEYDSFATRLQTVFEGVVVKSRGQEKGPPLPVTDKRRSQPASTNRCGYGTTVKLAGNIASPILRSQVTARGGPPDLAVTIACMVWPSLLT